MKSKKTYYKVVYKNPHGQLTSACLNTNIIGEDRIFALTYKKGIPTRPVIEGSPLFVFGKIFEAQNFIYQNYFSYEMASMQIWRCEVENPRVPHLPKFRRLLCIQTGWDEINKCRTRKKSPRKDARTSIVLDVSTTWPKGTYWCSSVTLKEKVG